MRKIWNFQRYVDGGSPLLFCNAKFRKLCENILFNVLEN